MEIDNFFCSHRCTLSVRLWLGARSVLAHQRVPLCQFLFPLFRGFLFPRPQ